MNSRHPGRLSRFWKLLARNPRGVLGLPGCLVAGLVMLGYGITTLIELPRRGTLMRVEGEATHVTLDSTRHENTGRGAFMGPRVYYVKHLTFELRNTGPVFRYDDRSPHFHWLKRALRPGVRATVGYLPGDPGYAIIPLEIRIGSSNVVSWETSRDEAIKGAVGSVCVGLILITGAGFFLELARLQAKEEEAAG